MSREDELARTATATTSPTSPVTPLGAMLGRYKLERELGSGGMGVVHAAFDPDLERRVALKVLRNAASGDEGRQRLLREARAMARLAHPNVVVVHEVGSTSDRDYIAMELIDGGTVDDWLRAAARTPAEIFETFDAAGRGLAAAHAAGLVHRDFKPHNVLRGRDGRVVVTDFGLARGVEAIADPLAATQELAASTATASATPSASSLSGLTRTGSVLGTPAYMAPEQWRGVVGPASDQFAYCVALWEALAHERPFRADSAIALRALVERGPAAADLAKLPRRVRAALRRGLDPDPARRWPTMDALLAALRAGERRSRRAWQAIGMVGVSALVFVAISIATYHHDPAVVVPAFACEPPALDPSAVWPASRAAALTARGQTVAATQLAADVEQWSTARHAACELGAAGGERRACLDAVLSRLDAVAHGVEQLAPDAHRVDAASWLVDPAVCATLPAPRLAAASPQLREVIARVVHDDASEAPADRAALRELLDRAAPDPCASALAARLAVTAEETTVARSELLARAEADAERCGDDRVRAEIALAQATAPTESEVFVDKLRANIQHAETAVARVPQADLTASLEVLRGAFAERTDELDAAIAHDEAAVAGFAKRGRVQARVAASSAALTAREVRARPDDIAALPAKLAELHAFAAAQLGEQDPTALAVARAQVTLVFSTGDVAASHAQLAALHRPRPQLHPRRITGRVVDVHGTPVAGALVTAGPELHGDGVTAVVCWPPEGYQRTATTDATGAFAIDDAAADGALVAERGALRSWGVPIADGATLVIGPTSQLSGKVELHGVVARNVDVQVRDMSRIGFHDYVIVAPVDRDGRFTLAGVPHGDLELMVVASTPGGLTMANTRLQLTAPTASGIALALPAASRTVQVIVRSTVSGALGSAQVMVVDGKRPASMTATEMNHRLGIQALRFARALDGEHAPPAVLAKARPHDLFTTLTNVGDGDVSVCAIALPTEDDPTTQRKVSESYDKLSFRCVPIPPSADVVTVEVPPWPRLD